MQGFEQLSTFPAAEGTGRSSMEESPSGSQEQKGIKSSMSHAPHDSAPSPPSPRPLKAEKRGRTAVHLSAGPYLHPLPTIETLMAYPSISRPVYDRLVRGEPPAQNYKTIIHTPKPPNMRALDQNLLRAAEMQAFRRRKRANSGLSARSRSSTTSSTASYVTDSSSVAADSESSSSDVSEPSSPASVSSTAKATIASSPAGSPRFSLFPSLTPEPVLAPIAVSVSPKPSPSSSTESLIHYINAYSNTPSQNSSRSPSPTQSFHSSLSTFSDAASDIAAPSTSRSSAPSPEPSPASSAYPSPPTSPRESRRSSSSGEEYMAYPSPPPSPQPSQQQIQHRERRAFSFPPPAVPSPTNQTPALRHRSVSLHSHPYTPPSSCPSDFDAIEFDLGEQRLGGGPLYEDDGDMDLSWSMNGGEVVYGAAGVAMSPRAMKGTCCPCEFEEKNGLGLYVIDEEEEAS